MKNFILLILLLVNSVSFGADSDILRNIYRIQESGGTDRISLTAPSLASSYALTLPSAACATGTIIRFSSSGVMGCTTPTYPNAASTSGKVMVSDGTNFIVSTPTFPNASATSGKAIVSDGTNWIASTPTFPNASATSGKIIRSDGTNWIASTPTYPTTAGGAGSILRSDGTNYLTGGTTYPDTGTSGGIPYYSASGAISSSGALTASQPVLGGGAGASPTSLTAGTAAQLLQSNGASAPTWINPSTLQYVSKSGNYTLVAATDDIVVFTAAATATLPTAVGITGKVFRIVNVSAAAANITINTTSSQTIGTRASGAIILRRQNNFIDVQSDGANYIILAKQEHEVMSAVATGSINGASNSFQANSATLTLTIGEWDTECSFAVYGGSTGVGVQFFDTSGLYQADGANTVTTPTAISSQTDGGTTYNYGGYGITTPVSTGTISSPPFRTRIIVTSGTQAVYAVPNILYGTAGTSNAWVSHIKAFRVW